MVKRKLIMISILFLIMVGLAACSTNESTEDNGKKETNPPASTENSTSVEEVYLNTKNVTRLNADDPIEAAVLVSKTIWPATHKENRPGTVILAPVENWQISLASANLIHHPNNGPILFMKDGAIPQTTMKEIERLHVLGNSDGVEIMIMGDVEQSVLDQLNDYEVEQVETSEPSEFARQVDRVYADVSGEIPNGVIIVSSEEEAKLYSLIAANWIAHMPEPVLYVKKDEIPEATKEALELRDKKANIYILGPNSIISDDIEKELKDYGSVERIAGDNPVETSIAFAQFKDKKTKFGWGVDEPGHGFEFLSTETPEIAIAGAPFAHLGKHAPMIWLDGGKITDSIHEYLLELQPKFTDDPSEGPYNHAYLIGSEEFISFEDQGMLDLMLEISPENGGGHGGH